MSASQLTYLERTDSEEEDSSSTLAEDQIYDFITNEPVKDSRKERTLQAVARSLVYEYGFDHTQLERDVTVTYEVTDPHGRTRRTRRKVDLVVYPEGKPKELKHIVWVAIVQPPGTKAQDRKKGVELLEEVMGALPTCDYGLWTNGADLEFRQKVTGGGRIQPEYVELYDLPGEGETASALDNPRCQVMRIATGDNLKRTFARVHDYIYGNQGLKKDVAFWQVVNLIFCKIHDEKAGGRPRFYVKGTERNTSEGQAAIAGRVHALFEEVKTDSDYAAVFTERDTITLNNRVLAYVLGELGRYNLFKDSRFLMGAVDNQVHMKQINMIMRELRRKLTLDALRSEIEKSDLSEGQRRIARVRLDIAAQSIQDSRLQLDAVGGFVEEQRRLSKWLRPGRLIIVDLRDELIDKNEALGLFVVMLNIFASAGCEAGVSPGGRPFNKLIVGDEAHKYMDNPDVTGHIVEVIHQMRHQGVSVLIDSQDLPSLPNAIIELSSLVILHRFNSPQWLKHVQRSITSLADLTSAQMAALRPGEAFVWANKATERVFTQKAVKMRFRPRVTLHGGETKKAV
jgi:hypothetical protein